MNKFRIENVVFCEAVRQEIGNKHTLLGVSAPEVNIGEIPATIAVALWISARPTSTGPFKIDIRVLDVDKNELVKAEAGGEVAALGRMVLVLGPLPINVQKPGDYEFEWAFGDDLWENIGTYKINLLQPEITVASTS